MSRFYFEHLESPTYYNLCKHLTMMGWSPSPLKWLSHFNDQHFAFDSAAAEQLEYKHLLFELVSQSCPDSMPATYYIDDQNWQSVLDRVWNQYYRQGKAISDQVDQLVWILKPSLLNNGQHIKIFQKLSELKQHFINTDRLGGEHVLQQYIINPHLLQGYKYSIRMFLVLSNYAGAYLYPKGYFNIARQRYNKDDFNNLGSHLTNEHLNPFESNIIQVPILNLETFQPIHKQIKKILEPILDSLKRKHPEAFNREKKKEPALAIFGFDFLVDENMRVWLLEANHGPCFPVQDDHPLQEPLYKEFWKVFIECFVMPIAKREILEKISCHLFESINTLARHQV